MSLWLIPKILLVTGSVGVAGAIGGVVNALLTDNGFIWPYVEQVNGIRITRPGFIGNIFISAVAAVISWGLYGPFAQANLLEGQALSLTPSTFAGAILVGIAGAKWLTNEVDKRLLKVAAIKAAKAHSSPEVAELMLWASPSETLNITKKLQL
ncbi:MULTISPECIES: hypothetical protein [Trichocoleus]|uniref:Uncharacterized protein n=1 Tax=Trichocoleus desertorum GB2-A4 TaxID=2933944 RepID=A0ABV0JEK2_9CYAN|nr:hypothetical protein [Trichocoleus sp. FACHB-46]MBD1862402.1 hypothetical protein [Trichocoleus sp. FACHB-46]